MCNSLYPILGLLLGIHAFIGFFNKVTSFPGLEYQYNLPDYPKPLSSLDKPINKKKVKMEDEVQDQGHHGIKGSQK